MSAFTMDSLLEAMARVQAVPRARDTMVMSPTTWLRVSHGLPVASAHDWHGAPIWHGMAVMHQPLPCSTVLVMFREEYEQTLWTEALLRKLHIVYAICEFIRWAVQK